MWNVTLLDVLLLAQDNIRVGLLQEWVGWSQHIRASRSQLIRRIKVWTLVQLHSWWVHYIVAGVAKLKCGHWCNFIVGGYNTLLVAGVAKLKCGHWCSHSWEVQCIASGVITLGRVGVS